MKIRGKIALTAFIFTLLFISKANADAMITNIRTQEYGTSVRFVVELSKEVKFRAFTLTNPNRVVIDLYDTEAKVTNSNFKTGITIDAVRIGKFKDNTARVVLDINSEPIIKKQFALKASNDNKNYRVVIDLEKNQEDLLGALIAENIFPESENSLDNLIDSLLDEKEIKEVKSPVIVHDKKIEQDEIVIKQDGKKRVVSTAKKGYFTIVIDAGHGGKDSGTIGVRGTKEKSITLAYAKSIKEALDRNKKYKVYLTRSGDYFIPLGDRVKRARKYGADLFISVHADSSPNNKARGLSVYTLSQEASDRRTATLAQAENKADILSGMDLFGEYQDTINVLVDLSRRTSMNLSSRLAETMVKVFMEKDIRTLKGPHKYGNFAVLLAPDIPSVLIELAFLSNKDDEKMLNGAPYRKKISEAVRLSIDRYFNNQ